MPSRRNRGNRKRTTPARPARVSPRRLLDRTREALARGDGRAALDLIGQLRDRDDKLPDLPLLSFCACVQRVRQLAAKGRDEEAAALRDRADRYRTAIAPRALSEDDWVRYVRHLDGADAMSAYAARLAEGPPLPRVERTLADRLVTERCWDGLDAFDPGHPLRRAAAEVRPGVDAMDAGDWPRAAALLQGVPRRSPFAAWRLFCRAMVCFDEEDDDGLRRVVDHLPPDFVLARTVAECRRLVGGDGGDGGDGGGAGEAGVLGGARGGAEALAGRLRRALGKEDVQAVGTAIEQLADVIYPDDPVAARVELLEITALAAARERFPLAGVDALADRLLPPERAAVVMARIILLGPEVRPELWTPAAAKPLLDQLPVEFPAMDRARARACVLESLARTGRAARLPDWAFDDVKGVVRELLGRRVESGGMILVNLMTESLAADPDNRDGHLFVVELLRERDAPRRRLQRALEDMAHRFPDDPTPWIELATLHYAGNAYRRAEKVLTEARRRAPHDDRLLDLQAVGFLMSAEQSRNRSRFARAAQDLQRAEDLGRRVLEPVLPAKRLLLDVVSRAGNASAAVDRHLAPLAPAEQLRTLALLVRDLSDNRHVRNVGPALADAAEDMLAARVDLARGCGPDDVVRLLEPLPAAVDILYPDRRMAQVLAPWWSVLLEGLDGDRLPGAFDILLDCGGRAAVRAEIERRLRGVPKARRDPLLLFCRAVFRYQDRRDRDARRLKEAVHGVDAATRERLREAAALLARHAEDPLRRALLTFDFARLDAPPPAPRPPRALEEFISLLEAEIESESGAPPDEPPPRPAAAAGPRPGELFPRGPEEDPDFEPPPRRAPGGERFRPASRGGPGDARRGAQREERFDPDLLEDIDGLERLIDDQGLRGEPAVALRELAGNMRAEPSTRRDLDRIARECEAGGLRDELSPELDALLFARRKKKGRRR